MIGRTIPHCQILDKLGEGRMAPALCWCILGGVEIGTDNARRLPQSGQPPAAVEHILDEWPADRRMTHYQDCIRKAAHQPAATILVDDSGMSGVRLSASMQASTQVRAHPGQSSGSCTRPRGLRGVIRPRGL
jgi:hypothetical protein